MNRNKHLTLEDRQIIAASLNENNSFKTIGMVLHKDCTTIAKEVKRNYTVVKSGCFGHGYNNLFQNTHLHRLQKPPVCQ